MANRLKELVGEATAWRLMVDAAKKGAEAGGYKLVRMPGRGLSNIYTAERDGKTQTVSIRTTRDRWIAFPPLAKGTKWKTLNDVDLVLVSTVDSKDDPKKVETYLLPADEVGKRFNAAYAARVKAGHVVRDNYGMWVALDPKEPGSANSVGSGILKGRVPLAAFTIDELIAGLGTEIEPEEIVQQEVEDHAHAEVPDDESSEAPRTGTIADVMAWARQRISEIAGVRPDAVKLDLKLEI
ncbi:MAG: hypothetical protein RO009_06955 [Pseudorhodoplanes sp.]|nr:hypothetical protein [Pseudorhodoplanes sp.]